ncbi:MAG: hypothetical protein AMJ93_06295 [Anaerolineae bacterium SM23_84]|jgi:hypothetical protein|nr:MAG: hypothetical protein AMJ93_06295 [Anaerolineae bacterium SM23_84]
MVPTPSAELLLVVGIGAVGASIIEAALAEDILSGFVAHLLGALLALLFAYRWIVHGPLDLYSIILYLMERRTVAFIAIAAVTASLVEAGLKRHPLKCFVAHYFGLLFAAVFIGWL